MKADRSFSRSLRSLLQDDVVMDGKYARLLLCLLNSNRACFNNSRASS